MPVRGVIFASGEDRSDAINAAAEQYGVPARLLVAGAIMESDLTEWARRPRNAADDTRYWPDCSGGAFQQTVLYAPLGNHTASWSNIAEVMDRLCNDFDFALDVAAPQYARYWQEYHDPLEVFSRYNGGPGLAFADNPNADHIRDSWERSAVYEVGDGDDTMADQQLISLLGYLQHDVADALRSAVDSARAAKTAKAREAAWQAVYAAIDTLQRGG